MVRVDTAVTIESRRHRRSARTESSRGPGSAGRSTRSPAASRWTPRSAVRRAGSVAAPGGRRRPSRSRPRSRCAVEAIPGPGQSPADRSARRGSRARPRERVPYRRRRSSRSWRAAFGCRRRRVPGSVGNFGRFAEVPAAVAYRRLRAAGVDEHEQGRPAGHHRRAHRHGDVPDRPGADAAARVAVLVQGRGRSRLGAGAGDVRSVHPAARCTVSGHRARATRSRARPRSRRRERRSRSRSRAPPPGTGPCEANYRVSAVSTQQAVAFTITRLAAPVPPGQACPALAVHQDRGAAPRTAARRPRAGLGHGRRGGPGHALTIS